MIPHRRVGMAAPVAPAPAPSRKRARAAPAINVDESDDDVVAVKRPRLQPSASSASSSSSSGRPSKRVVIDLDDDEIVPLDWTTPILPSSESLAPVAGPSRPRQRALSPVLSPVERLAALFPDLSRAHALVLLAEPRFTVAESPVDAVADHLFGLGGEVRSHARCLR